jgi:hypothetical protein
MELNAGSSCDKTLDLGLAKELFITFRTHHQTFISTLCVALPSI